MFFIELVHSSKVLCLFVILLIFGLVSGNEDGGEFDFEKNEEFSDTDESSCLSTTSPEESMKALLNCYLTVNGSNFLEEAGRFPPVVELRKLVTNFCDNSVMISDCAKILLSNSETCLDENSHIMLELNHAFMNLVREVICSQDGDRLVQVFTHARLVEGSMDDVARRCFHKAVDEIGEADTNDPEEDSLRQYRTLKLYKECIVDSGEGKNMAVNVAESLLNEILIQAPCFYEDIENFVLCESLNDYVGE